MQSLKKHKRVHPPTGKSMTKQSMAAECDIHNILRGYHKTGLVSHVSKHQGNYEDLTSIPDYHESINFILEAQESFNSLPSHIRKRFHNDPQAFIDFVDNPQNRDELVSMGLIPGEQNNTADSVVDSVSESTAEAVEPPEATS